MHLLKHKCGEQQPVAMLPIKRLPDVVLEMNLRECTSNMSLLRTNKASHSGCEAQRRMSLEVQTGVPGQVSRSNLNRQNKTNVSM